VKPDCILHYNRCMGGVDLVDQQLDSVLVIRRSYKWYKKIFFRLLMQCLLSAHKLYRLRGGQNDFLRFLHDAVTQLIVTAPKLQSASAASMKTLDSVARLTDRNHFPVKRAYDGESTSRSSKSKCCRICYARGICVASGKPIQTAWICETCPSEPGLCVEKGCFKAYHTYFDYSQTN
jgi:hypothetical protein